MTAVIYARYSSDNQKEESIDGQLRECKSYAERNGIKIINSYIDRALSAKTDNRPVPSSDSGGRELIIETTGGIVSDGTNKINPNAAADLTLEALYEQIGELLPNELPEGFLFESALLSDYGYSVLWSKGLEDINWKIRDYKEEYSNRITSVDDKKNYDLALYPIPRAESVPEELFEIVDDPIFRAEDLTLEAVKARAYKVDEIGDSKGYRMMFSVLYGKKLVTVISKGVSPEWLFECLSGLSSTDY